MYLGRLRGGECVRGLTGMCQPLRSFKLYTTLYLETSKYCVRHLTTMMCSACFNHTLHIYDREISVESDSFKHGRCYQSDLSTGQNVAKNAAPYMK